VILELTNFDTLIKAASPNLAAISFQTPINAILFYHY